MSICACINSDEINFDETYSTLLFASLANLIKVNPKLNCNTFVKVITKFLTLISRLKNFLFFPHLLKKSKLLKHMKVRFLMLLDLI